MLGEQLLTGRRVAQGGYANGDWVDGEETPLRFKGSIQPLTDRDTQQLPEAWRTMARWKVYTRTRLRQVDVEDQTKGDRVNWDGKELLVVGENNQYQTPRGMKLKHYRYALVEQQVEDED